MRAVRVALLIVVGMALTISTTMRVHVFQDERLIWQDAVNKAPEKPRPWINLGRQYVLLGNPRMARWSYETAIELARAPGRTHDERVIAVAFAHANLGVVFRNAGETRQAVYHFNAAGSTFPNNTTLMRVTLWTDDILAR